MITAAFWGSIAVVLVPAVFGFGFFSGSGEPAESLIVLILFAPAAVLWIWAVITNETNDSITPGDRVMFRWWLIFLGPCTIPVFIRMLSRRDERR